MTVSLRADARYRGADIDGDGRREHARTHVGELQWGTDPTDESPAETPSPTLSLTIDYYAGVDAGRLDTDSWRTAVERNFALYGIGVSFTRGKTLTDSYEVTYTRNDGEVTVTLGKLGGLTANHLRAVYEKRDASIDTDAYVLVANKSGNNPTNNGAHLYKYPVVSLYTVGIADIVTDRSLPRSVVDNSPYETERALVAAGTAMHELGHVLDAGELDDRDFRVGPHVPGITADEVYSGAKPDRTPEYIAGDIERGIMASGLPEYSLTGPNAGRYYFFSIEELLSIRDHDQ